MYYELSVQIHHTKDMIIMHLESVGSHAQIKEEQNEKEDLAAVLDEFRQPTRSEQWSHPSMIVMVDRLQDLRVA